ncbi:4-(cytidine 5'-diphospho)-2-C-methyl-D-erythritol kinase [Permianibacter sp. IMCC34836]|uniref:4-(cytidine 5'-diphospho)-2-C-methyl-D-erythritol kinase n=1 Tax=Permianibacter fluminis TaxID=2738515 RepID=UPI0015556E24|nr:4-(cytidine 5'-diphospho)-2-C-methyl-D-erythritol kinase [Permianibacter fluminis]NQD36945.1 4-(cytidine 5'-diphospho)-2-C-methyl-D-erythritol kinase [Permianibacter fluminis]
MPTTELNLLSPAKLNLFLHVTGRRPDGYHLLETAFQLLDYGDDMVFRRRDDGVISLSPALPGVATEDNLVARAARALQAETGCRLGAGIQLHKRIAMGGGLGGGSSNAATTLRALNRLWRLGLNVETLARIGLALGADVPVFVRAETAYATGIGEVLTALDLPRQTYVVLTPAVAVPTAEIFQHPALTRDHQPCTIRALADRGWFERTTNDCEPLVRTLYPAVNTLIERLQNLAPTRMTGTGSSVFALARDETHAQQMLDACVDLAPGFIAHGVPRSALYDCV